MNHCIPVVVVALVSSVLGGCATQQPQSPAAGLTEPIHPPVPPNLGTGPGTAEIEDIGGPYNIYVSETIRVCSGPNPFFAFDVSKPMGGDQPTMRNLIACMVSGPLQGRTIKLIGHTDPRGTGAYNEQLGLQRAEKVKKFLVASGTDPARILIASMGAEDAATGPSSWPADRRVQIELVP